MNIKKVGIAKIENPYTELLTTQQPISVKEFLEEADQFGGSKRKKAGRNKNGRPKPGITVATLETED